MIFKWGAYDARKAPSTKLAMVKLIHKDARGDTKAHSTSM